MKALRLLENSSQKINIWPKVPSASDHQPLWVFPTPPTQAVWDTKLVVYAVSKGAVQLLWRRFVDGAHRNPWLVSIHN